MQTRARGGDTSGWALVGEEGPEIVRLPVGSHVFPSGVIPRFAAGGTMEGDPGAMLHGAIPTALGSASSPLIVQLDSLSFLNFHNHMQEAMNTALRGPNLLTNEQVAALAVIATYQAAPQQKQYSYIEEKGGAGQFAPESTAISYEEAYKQRSMMGSGGTLIQGYRPAADMDKDLMAQLPSFVAGGHAASLAAAGQRAASGGSIDRSEFVVNTTVNAGVVVGNQKELANVISKENTHSLQQAIQSGQR